MNKFDRITKWGDLLAAGAMGAGLMAMFIVVSNPCQAGDLRVGVMPASHHFNDRVDDDDEWNESHSGILIEHRLTPEGDWIGTMYYENSIDETSFTVYGASDAYFYSSNHIDAGIVYGAVTGYDFPLIPYVLPTVTAKFTEQLKVRGLAFPVGVAAQVYLEF